MAESTYEQALAALKARFDGITSANSSTGEPYWYKPNAVIRTHAGQLAILNDRFQVVYAIWPEDIRVVEVLGQQLHLEPRFFVLVARQHPQGDVPHKEDSGALRTTVQNRLIRDAQKALAIDVTLGGLVENCELRTWVQSSQQVYFAKWAVAIGRGVMDFDVDQAAP